MGKLCSIRSYNYNGLDLKKLFDLKNLSLEFKFNLHMSVSGRQFTLNLLINMRENYHLDTLVNKAKTSKGDSSYSAFLKSDFALHNGEQDESHFDGQTSAKKVVS